MRGKMAEEAKQPPPPEPKPEPRKEIPEPPQAIKGTAPASQPAPAAAPTGGKFVARGKQQPAVPAQQPAVPAQPAQPAPQVQEPEPEVIKEVPKPEPPKVVEQPVPTPKEKPQEVPPPVTPPKEKEKEKQKDPNVLTILRPYPTLKWVSGGAVLQEGPASIPSDFIGRRCTHCCDIPISSGEDIKSIMHDKNEITLRFDEAVVKSEEKKEEEKKKLATATPHPKVINKKYAGVMDADVLDKVSKMMHTGVPVAGPLRGCDQRCEAVDCREQGLSLPTSSGLRWGVKEGVKFDWKEKDFVVMFCSCVKAQELNEDEALQNLRTVFNVEKPTPEQEAAEREAKAAAQEEKDQSLRANLCTKEEDGRYEIQGEWRDEVKRLQETEGKGTAGGC
eukprot:Sspe_Gene.3839::Locus_1279_Transcript_1_1_Confidence_1.000_Length_2136::g.3839::m.3839